jgi:cytochrome b561
VRPSETAARYTRTAIALHWIVATLVIAEIAWGWWMQEIPKQPPGPRADAYNLHKSVGLSVLLLTVLRLGWRLSHPPPPFPALPAWNARLARANHLLMYVTVVTLTVGGYLGSAWSGFPVKFFGLTLPAWIAANSALKEFASTVHLAASWVLVVALAAHVAGSVKHALVDRNGALARMGVGRR